jgi:hypothetical protein
MQLVKTCSASMLFGPISRRCMMILERLLRIASRANGKLPGFSENTSVSQKVVMQSRGSSLRLVERMGAHESDANGNDAFNSPSGNFEQHRQRPDSEEIRWRRLRRGGPAEAQRIKVELGGGCSIPEIGVAARWH